MLVDDRRATLLVDDRRAGLVLAAATVAEAELGGLVAARRLPDGGVGYVAAPPPPGWQAPPVTGDVHATVAQARVVAAGDLVAALAERAYPLVVRRMRAVSAVTVSSRVFRSDLLEFADADASAWVWTRIVFTFDRTGRMPYLDHTAVLAVLADAVGLLRRVADEHAGTVAQELELRERGLPGGLPGLLAVTRGLLAQDSTTRTTF